MNIQGDGQSRQGRVASGWRARKPIRRRWRISIPARPRLFQTDTLWPWFERLRKEAPVHYCANAPIEPYWSITGYNDIMHVDTSHSIFSSDAGLGGISIRDMPVGYDWPSFIGDG